MNAELASDLSAVWLTLRLASVATLILLALGTPLAWWLAQTQSTLKSVVSAIVALPLVLPPTVLGFYLLLALGPNGIVGAPTAWLGLGTLAFSFPGLVIGSVLYSLPFAVQPIQNAFEEMGARPLEVAATLRADAWDRFTSVALPLARRGLVTAAVLSFAHTIGEFGVVLMIGGNIPGKTRVLSVAIYDHVEASAYTQAHWLAAGNLIFAFAILFLVYHFNQRSKPTP